MQVVNATTAANYFHLLRRQMRRSFRKPLIVASPKKLLRFKDACSDIEEFKEGIRFHSVLKDTNKNLVPAEKVKRVILCSGQVYYDLEAARAKEGKNDIAIVRVEQLCPFPFRRIAQEVGLYKNAEIMWAQEEPQNQGPYLFVLPRLQNLAENLKRDHRIHYAGREEMAATSTGYSKLHEKELRNLLKKAMTLSH